jgi:ribosomal protein L10
MPNTKNIDQVNELKESFSKATAIYFTEYHGLNVGDITRLRGEFF